MSTLKPIESMSMEELENLHPQYTSARPKRFRIRYNTDFDVFEVLDTKLDHVPCRFSNRADAIKEAERYEKRANDGVYFRDKKLEDREKCI